jgi:hypothetical protein
MKKITRKSYKNPQNDSSQKASKSKKERKIIKSKKNFDI